MHVLLIGLYLSRFCYTCPFGVYSLSYTGSVGVFLGKFWYRGAVSVFLGRFWYRGAVSVYLGRFWYRGPVSVYLGRYCHTGDIMLIMDSLTPADDALAGGA